jgi:hypothetical protein
VPLAAVPVSTRQPSEKTSAKAVSTLEESRTRLLPAAGAAGPLARRSSIGSRNPPCERNGNFEFIPAFGPGR